MKRYALWLFLLPLICFAQMNTTVIPGRVSLRHFEADGVGFNGGYTTIEAMMATPFNYHHIPFIDLRYHVFDRGRSALNTGLGYRFNANGLLFGVNGYYDARWTTGQTFSQFGAGVEVLSRFLDLRANGYFPVKFTKDIVEEKFAGFAGHSLAIKLKERLALTGGNGELGAYIGRLGQIKMYLAGGSYYFKQSVCNTKVGVSGRLRFSWRDNIWAQFSVQHDDLYKTNYQGTISFSYPFWPKPSTNHWNFFPNFEALMIQPVERNDIIVLCDTTRIVEGRNKNGEPIFIWFVDNTSSSDGTFEDPFPTLVQAQNASSPGQYIYVFPGDGTTTGMDAGITLKSKQFFFGAGVTQYFPTAYGTVKVPPFASSNPNITNLAGIGVTLANNNVVRGFNIASPTSHGISGSNIGTTLINLTSITGAGGNGIQVASSSSNTVDLGITDCTCSTSGSNGIDLLPSNSSNMTALIQNSTVNSNTGNGLFLMSTDSSDVILTANSSNSFSSNTASGINLSVAGQSLTATINDNKINTNTGTGINIAAGSSILGQFTISSNTINMPGASGINFASSNSSRLSGTISTNTISSTGTSGIVVSAINTSGPNINISNNTITSVAGQGMSLSSTSTTPGVTAVVSGNTINTTVNNGISLVVNGTMNITASGNSIKAPGSDGISITGSGIATLSGTISSTSIDMSGGVGVHGILINSATAGRTYNLTLSSNTITGPGAGAGDGIRIASYGSNNQNITISNNNITNYTGGRAVYAFVSSGNPTVSLDISNNSNFSGNASGISINPSSTSNFTTSIVSNTISSTTADDFSYLAASTSASQLSVTDNSFSDTVTITTSNASTLCLIMTNNTATTYTLTNPGVSGNFTVQSSDAPGITDMQASNIGTFSPLSPAGVVGVTSCP